MNIRSASRHGLTAFALAFAATTPLAGPGHDHGDEAAPAAGDTAAPRFSAASELFELVGVIQGKRLTVYLDHAATNEPVKDGKVELEIGGAKVVLQPHADGEFDAELAAALKPGVHPVTATVSTANDSDLLAGELDLHEAPSAAPAAHAFDWKRIATWAGGGLIVVLGLSLAVRAALRRRGARLPALPTGGVA